MFRNCNLFGDELPFWKLEEIQKPGFLVMSGIRKVYSTLPASSTHNSFNEDKNLADFSASIRFTIGQESTTYDPTTGFDESTLCSSTSTTYHLPIIWNQYRHKWIYYVRVLTQTRSDAFRSAKPDCCKAGLCCKAGRFRKRERGLGMLPVGATHSFDRCDFPRLQLFQFVYELFVTLWQWTVVVAYLFGNVIRAELRKSVAASFHRNYRQ